MTAWHNFQQLKLFNIRTLNAVNMPAILSWENKWVYWEYVKNVPYLQWVTKQGAVEASLHSASGVCVHVSGMNWWVSNFKSSVETGLLIDIHRVITDSCAHGLVTNKRVMMPFKFALNVNSDLWSSNGENHTVIWQNMNYLCHKHSTLCGFCTSRA